MDNPEAYHGSLYNFSENFFHKMCLNIEIPIKSDIVQIHKTTSTESSVKQKINVNKKH